MTSDERRIQTLLSARLEPPSVPPAESVWLTISVRLRRERASARKRRALTLSAAMAVAALLVLTAGLAAASSDIRAWLGGMGVAMSGSPRGVSSLYPAPGFTVLQPSSLPEGWIVLANGYNPSPARDGASGWSGVSAAAPSVSGATVARRVGGQDVSATTSEQAQARVQDLLAGREATFVLICADADDRLVEIVERSAAGKALPVGATINVRGVSARISPDALSFVDHSTLVEISGSAGRDDWLRFAALLEPTPLAPFESTAAGQALPQPSAPPAWTRIPLSARLGDRVAPAVSRADIVRGCGWDTPPASKPPGQAAMQVRCAARLASGSTEEQGGYGVSQLSWQQAAERLGIDLAAGPRGDPQVYLFESDRAEGSGSVVVLDATSGEPYLVAHLKPGTP